MSNPFGRPSYMKGPDWGFWGTILAILAVFAIFVAFMTAGWWAPCSWYGGVSVMSAPVRCVGTIKP